MSTVPSCLLALLEGDVNAPAPLGPKVSEVVNAIKSHQSNDPLLVKARNKLYEVLLAILNNPDIPPNPTFVSAIGMALANAFPSNDPKIQDLREELKRDIEAAL